ncbi:MAG TPA: phosphopyruvate hydratase, partial [Candidatus Paceibacterota bacterium]|nr:phosphopyruvate hydratase [Candidatus Paceibacterota bacterium]
ITARSISDTRGRATIETTLTAGPLSATASVPSGKSTGSHEALELRDADGGVATAIAHVQGEIAEALSGRSFATADEIDLFLIALDGTPNKSRLGANALLSVSIAAERLFAQEANVPLWRAIANRAGTTPSAPRLYVNVMNGGVHADFRLPFQEYILVVNGDAIHPMAKNVSAADTYEPLKHAYAAAQQAFAKLGERLGSVALGDEGGYAPTFAALDEPFALLADLVKEFPGTSIAIDAAASELYRDGSYQLLGKSYAANELSFLYEDLVERFPFHSIEDPFSEDAADDFTRFTEALGGKILVIGDDLTVTNPARITEAAGRQEINAVLIKPNQIGTVSEAILAVQETHDAGWKAVASHRSGETNDTFIADFAYGVGAHGIKAGGLGQKERVEKYDRLLAIEQEAGVL